MLEEEREIAQINNIKTKKKENKSKDTEGNFIKITKSAMYNFLQININQLCEV